MSISMNEVFDASYELIGQLNDPVFGLKVMLIVAVILVGVAVALWIVRNFFTWFLSQTDPEKRKNDEQSFDVKPKREDESAVIEWAITDDGEIKEITR